jgi:hypothetical protein
MRHGGRIKVSLIDGSTLSGVLRFSWGWWSYRITDVQVLTQNGPQDVPGMFLLPRRHVLHVQVVGG